MVNSARFTPEEYLVYLDIDDRCHILVEGPNDQRVVDLLFDAKFPKVIGIHVVIDTAQMINESKPENREIIETICDMILDRPYSDKLVGFVDREFRGFSLHPDLKDDINCHRITGRAVWSRGHSIENYLFEFDVLRAPLIDYAPSSFTQALESFEGVFESTMRIACAVSLAAKDLQKLNRVRSSINETILCIDDSGVSINLDIWRKELSKMIPHQETEELFGRFHFWLGKTWDADYNVVRWLCDGHIGFRFIWSVYDVCVQSSAGSKLRRAKDPLPFNSCARHWVQKVIEGSCEYPSDIFRLLKMI